MKTSLRATLITLAAVGSPAALPPEARACTAFLGGGLVAKGYDWDIGYGMLVANPQGLRKRALPFHPTDRPAEWVATHASLTFNQYGRELPNGGINDAGLVVEVLWLDESAYPAPDDRPTVNELQWVQLQLDRYATTDEVVRHAREVRIALVAGRVHYFVCDARRACAVLEHVGGELVVTAGAALVVPAITNNTFAASIAYLRRHRGFGGEQTSQSQSGKSLDRFVRAATGAKQIDGTTPTAVDAVLRLLGSVAVGPRTQWNIVYDPSARRAYFKSRTSPALKHVDLAAVVSPCGATVSVLDIDHIAGGDVAAAFAPLSRARNLALIDKSMRETRQRLPREAAAAIAVYPESFTCVTPAPVPAAPSP